MLKFNYFDIIKLRNGGNMKKILTVGASNSSVSINEAVLSQIKGVDHISLRAYDMPMYSYDYESNLGIPERATELIEKFNEYDIIILAVPEYNGNIPAYTKNIIDWCTRIKLTFLEGKELGIICVTPGKNAGASVREILSNSLPFFGATVVLSHGVGSFTNIDEMKEQVAKLQKMVDDLK